MSARITLELLLTICGAGLLTASATFDVEEVVYSDAIGMVFTDKQPLVFGMDKRIVGPVDYIVSNWHGEVVAQGSWKRNETGKRTLPELPRGYYRMTLQSPAETFTGSRSFAVIVDPAERRFPPDSSFCVDTAQSWLGRPDPNNPRFPGAGYETVSELCRLAGIIMIRDRLSWKQVEPQPGKFRWGQYAENAEMLNQRNIKISGMYHDAPQWARHHSPKLPDDLAATYRFAEKLAKTFHGQMANWEFWNEEDTEFTSEPAWDYAATLKAAYLGFKAGDPQLSVAIGAFSAFPLKPYCQVVLSNDAAMFFDIFNFHIYSNLQAYPGIIKDLRTFLAVNGNPQMPIWITENGTRAEGFGKAVSYLPGKKIHSPEQEIIVAEFVPKSQIYLQSQGVEKSFFFVMSPYNEYSGSKDWGLLRQDYTAKPGYVAFAVLTDQLADCNYRGRITPAPAINAFLYEQSNGLQTLVYWTDSELDSDRIAPGGKIPEKFFTLKAPDGEYPVCDMLGTPSAVRTKSGALTLTASRFPRYIKNLSGLRPSIPAPKARASAATQKNDKDLSVILKPVLSPDFKLSAGKDMVELKNTAGKMKLEIWNLSNIPKDGSITVKGGTAEGLPERISVPPMNKVEYELSLVPAIAPDQIDGNIEFGGVFDHRPISRLVIPILISNRISTGCRSIVLSNADDPKKWRANTSGIMEISYDETEKAVKFETFFPPGTDDRWVYPEYVLRQPKESLRNVYAIGFDIKAVQEITKPYSCSLLMLVTGTKKEKGHSFMLDYMPPVADWENRIVVITEASPEKVKMLRLGLNPRANKVTYWIRNVKLFVKK